MNGEFKDPASKEIAWKVCKDFLGGAWKNISLEELRLFEVRGGLSNSLYRCALPEKLAKDPKTPKEALLRIYGPIQDNPNIILTEAVTFMLLSERQLGPKLYGLFPTGRLEEFIPSHSLSSDELRRYSLIIAREMAKIHAIDVPVKKVPDLFQTYAQKWLDEVVEVLRNDKEDCFMSYNEYKRQIEWVAKEMEKINSPVVYCHNDLQGGNVLKCENSTQNGKPNLILIDFEFGSYNYRGFDLANHLCEWCFDYDTDDYPYFRLDITKFPTKQEQREFFTAYLDQITKEGIPPNTSLDEEVEKMLKEIPLFASAAHLLWSLWSIKMVITSSSRFAHKIYLRNNSEETHNRETSTTSNYQHSVGAIEKGVIAAIQEHGKTRRKLFYSFKEQYLTSISTEQ